MTTEETEPPTAGRAPDHQRTRETATRLTRRGVLALASTGATGLLAGCGQSVGGDRTGTPSASSVTATADLAGSTDSSPPTGTHVGLTTADPSTVQYNPFNGDGAPAVSHHLLFEPFAKYYYADDAFRSAAIADWAHTGDAFVLTLRDGLSWTNGDRVTAADVALQFRLARRVGDPVWDWAGGVTVRDDRTVALSVPGDRNPALVEHDVFADRFVRVDRATYRPYLEDLRAGEPTAALAGFEDRTPNTCGPFRLAERSVAALALEPFDDHPDADAVGVETYEFRRPGASVQPATALDSATVDSIHDLAVPPERAAAFPDHVVSVTTPDVAGIGLTPDHAHLHLGDRAVRQAIAAVVDRAAVRDAALANARVIPRVPAPVPTSVQSAWLGDAIDSFEDYGPSERRVDAASERLTAAGYARQNGSWRGPDGDRVSVPITVHAARSDWVASVETVARQLRAFGFDATAEPVDDYWRRLADGDFALAASNWLHGGPTTHPYYSLRHQLLGPRARPVAYQYPAAAESPSDGSDGAASDGNGAAITVRARDGDGPLTVDPAARLAALAAAGDRATAAAIVRELAWVANRDLPMIPLTERLNQQWLTSDDWRMPGNLESDPDANVEWAPTWLARQGKLAPRA